MSRPRLLLALLLTLGCSPEIGDECSTSTDCSQSGDRLCDITQPGGYCTMFNCEPGDCPDEASCVIFGVTPSTLPGCEDPFGVTPYQRSFCLKTCESDGDCRSGYECANFKDQDNPWGAVHVDGGGKACAVPYSGVPITTDPVPSTDICSVDSPSPPPDGSSGANAGGASSGGESSGGESSGVSGAGGVSGGEAGMSSAEGGVPGVSGAGGQGGG
jgi:hypothetical protein